MYFDDLDPPAQMFLVLIFAGFALAHSLIVFELNPCRQASVERQWHKSMSLKHKSMSLKQKSMSLKYEPSARSCSWW